MKEALATDLDQVTVIEHAAFAVSDARGDMVGGSYHGFYVADTRYLSRCVLRIGGRRLERLSAATPDHRQATFYLTNPPIRRLPANSVAVFRRRQIGDGLAERIRIVSYVAAPLRLRLSMQLGVDFLDIIEVLGRAPMARSVSATLVDGGVHFEYEHGGYRRTTKVGVGRPFAFENDRFSFDLDLRHQVPWDLDVQIRTEQTQATRVRRMPNARSGDRARVDRWAARVPRLETDDPRLASAWRTAVRDLRALLLAVPGGSFIPAAGLPWFMAIYGRDALITALQTLIAGTDIAYGTLLELAAFQGRRDDPFRDEEPGRIPHEVRPGELGALGRVPHGRYYGSVDATPLYVRLFADACRWTGWLVSTASQDGSQGGCRASGPMPTALRRALPAAERALAWVDRAVREDGLVWYQRRNPAGISNQVWKDSGDSYRFADGRMADTPIAAIEVQGYAAAAWRGIADVFEALGRLGDAGRLRAAADAMTRRIDQAFWMDADGTYAMGLDRHGRQIDAITSNPGHLLWSGAVSPERAADVATRLTAPDMFSGWGIRTMSSEMSAFNPLSYHNGSVWPHDNSLIAAGFARYGETVRARRIFDGLLDAAMQDRASRLPELFAGFDRASTPDLVGYPVACAPQAWASGAILHLVQTSLDLDPAVEGPRVAPTPHGPHVRLVDLHVDVPDRDDVDSADGVPAAGVVG